MKQKITIEVENDTGVEFEERAECRIPNRGEYFISRTLDHKPKVIKYDNSVFVSDYIVLTPKIDHELESARKKFPVGSYVKHDNYGSTLFQVEGLDRSDIGLFVRIITKDKLPNLDADRCTPFPLPVWRCCESDRPKKEGYYPTRRKEAHGDYRVFKYCPSRWYGDFINYSCHEWLDEGGE